MQSSTHLERCRLFGCSVVDVSIESAEEREGAHALVLDSSRDVQIQGTSIATGGADFALHMTLDHCLLHLVAHLQRYQTESW